MNLGRKSCGAKQRVPVIGIRFAVTRFSFPDRQQIFPVLVTREFRWQAIEFPSESRGALAISSPKSANFPVFSRGTGKPTGGDRFADDCFLRQLVWHFCRENRLAGIIANCPQVSFGELAPQARLQRAEFRPQRRPLGTPILGCPIRRSGWVSVRACSRSNLSRFGLLRRSAL